jgi:NAD(P)-dependent dehydrogenase (short-subunit alcohol dehydrogenase family)
MTLHPAIEPGRTAVITGGASGIGLAAAKRFAGLGLNVVIADVNQEALDAARGELGNAHVEAVRADVSRVEDVAALRDRALEAFGDVAILMNNAGVGGGGSAIENPEGWRRVLETNLFGVLNGVQAFAPGMIAAGKPAAIVNTGSKQGITTPPGDTAYNVSKAGIKALTEGLQHTLRNTGLPGQRAPAGPRLHLHRHDPPPCQREAAGRLDARTGGPVHAGRHGRRRLLPDLPRQRGHARDRQRAHDLGHAGHHPEPAAALALAPGLSGGVRRVPGWGDRRWVISAHPPPP